MDNTLKKYALPAVLLFAVLVGLAIMTRPQAPVQPAAVAPRAGSVASPDLPYQYISVGGRQAYQGSVAISATSSTLCTINNPSSATSTIRVVTIQNTASGIAANQTLYISTTTINTVGSSTVALSGPITFTGAVQNFYVWGGNGATTTTAGSSGTNDANILPGRTSNFGSNYILKPNEALTIRVATATPGTFATYYTGTCTYEFDPL